jgi:DNA-binding NarL/FixJ family response regulator
MALPTQIQDRRRVLAACAVALATAVGSNGMASQADAKAIAKLERYCTASWRNAGIRRDQWEECTQQALLELIESVSNEGLPTAIEDSTSQERRELNRTVWRLVQRCRRSTHPQSFDECSMSPPGNERDGERRLGWDDVLQHAAGVLTTRQLQILELARDGWRVADIARQLGLPAERVSDEKYKAVAKLRERVSQLLDA